MWNKKSLKNSLWLRKRWIFNVSLVTQWISSRYGMVILYIQKMYGYTEVLECLKGKSRYPPRKSTKAIQRVIRHAIQIIRIYFYYTKFKKGKKKCIIFLMGTTCKVKSRWDKQFKCTHNSYWIRRNFQTPSLRKYSRIRWF